MFWPALTLLSLGLSGWALVKVERKARIKRRAAELGEVLMEKLSEVEFATLAEKAEEVYDRYVAGLGDKEGRTTIVFDLSNRSIYAIDAPEGGAVRWQVRGTLLPPETTWAQALEALREVGLADRLDQATAEARGEA